MNARSAGGNDRAARNPMPSRPTGFPSAMSGTDQKARVRGPGTSASASSGKNALYSPSFSIHTASPVAIVAYVGLPESAVIRRTRSSTAGLQPRSATSSRASVRSFNT